MWLYARVNTTNSLLTYKPLRNGCRSYCCVPSSSDSRGVWHDISGLFCTSFPWHTMQMHHLKAWQDFEDSLPPGSLMLPLSGSISSSRCGGRASPKALWVVLGMWLLAFHSERFKSQSEEDTLPSRIWPLSPTWLLLLNFIFLKSISKFTLKRSKAWFQKIPSTNSETVTESNWVGLRNIKDILTAFIEMFKVRLGRYGSLGYIHAAQRWAPEFD